MIITSTFYCLNHPEHEVVKKAFVIGCLSISAVILSYLYFKFENSNRNIMALLIIETIGNSILLIPSGGLNSPFVWYSLNTILISAIFLKGIYSWLNFSMYLLNYYIISYSINGITYNIFILLKNESNILLSFIMIIVAIHAWSVFIEKTREKSLILEEVNMELESANEMILESINHINSLYQTVNLLTNQGNKEGLINVLFKHMRSITKSNMSFYYDISGEINKMTLYDNKSLLGDLEEAIVDQLDTILEYNLAKEIIVSDCRFLVMTIKINHIVHGIVGLEIQESKESIIYKNNLHQLQFLSELISLGFERLSLEEINNRLLITQEQNRIANEIHDGVLQRLFSMSCGVFSLIKKLEYYSKDQIEKELNLFREITDSTMKDLRNKIYGLSWKKSGYNSFSMDIKSYIGVINKINKINIPFIINGNEELLSYQQKRALYSIICEGIGNAFRHGKAKNIEINLNIDSEFSRLEIIDDGIGFDLEVVTNKKIRGIGLENLYQLTMSLHGDIEIITDPNKGTSIEIVLPNNIERLKGAKAI